MEAQLFLKDVEVERLERYRAAKDLRESEMTVIHLRQQRVNDAKAYLQLKILSLQLEENLIKDDKEACLARKKEDEKERLALLASVKKRLGITAESLGYDPETLKVILP